MRPCLHKLPFENRRVANVFLSRVMLQPSIWTCTYPNNAKAQIDCILIKKWINSSLNCVTKSFLEGIYFDHRIVTAKIHLNLSRNKIEIVKTTRYNWSPLNNRDISNEYTVTIKKNKFDSLQKIYETHTSNE